MYDYSSNYKVLAWLVGEELQQT